MANLVWGDVTTVAKDLATVPLQFQTMVLAHVNERVNPDVFGGEDAVTFTLARAYYAAHFGALFLKGAWGRSGPTTSQTEGGITQSFATMAPTNPLMRTNYGDAFLSLVRRSPASVGFTT